MTPHPFLSVSRSDGRRAIAAAMVAGLLALDRPANAGQIVVLRSRMVSPDDAAITGFETAYRGQAARFTIEDAGAAGLRDHISALRPDAVVAIGLRAALYARDHLPRTPLVYCAVQEPRRHQLAGAWITGVSTAIPLEVELASLRNAAPDVKRVAVFFGRESGATRVPGMRAAATAAGLELVEVPLADLSELADRARAVVSRVDALWMPDPLVAASEPFRFLLRLSLDQRERAGDIPAATVQHTRLVINGATARALGRELPLAVRRDGEILP